MGLKKNERIEGRDRTLALFRFELERTDGVNEVTTVTVESEKPWEAAKIAKQGMRKQGRWRVKNWKRLIEEV